MPVVRKVPSHRLVGLSGPAHSRTLAHSDGSMDTFIESTGHKAYEKEEAQ